MVVQIASIVGNVRFPTVLIWVKRLRIQNVGFSLDRTDRTNIRLFIASGTVKTVPYNFKII